MAKFEKRFYTIFKFRGAKFSAKGCSELLLVWSGLKTIHPTKPMQCLTLQMEGYGQNLQSISRGIVREELFRLINPSERIIPGSESRELNPWLPLVAWWWTTAIIDLARWWLEGLISRRRQIGEMIWRPSLWI